MAKHCVDFEVNSSPLEFFLDAFKLKLEASKQSLSLTELGFELGRVESRSDPANAFKVLVTLYPSDALFDFAAAIFARDRELGGVE